MSSQWNNQPYPYQPQATANRHALREERPSRESPFDGVVALVLVGFLSGGAAAVWGLDLLGDLNQPLYPVSGQVRFEGAAASGAQIRLHSLVRQQSATSKRHASRDWPLATGRANERGEFELKTRSVGAGVPAGEYAVTVTWPLHVVSGEDYLPGPNVLPAEYADPSRTPLRVVVDPGLNGPLTYNLSRCEIVSLAER